MLDRSTSAQSASRGHLSRAFELGWAGALFWAAILSVMLLLLVCGYSALFKADVSNLRFALLGGLSGFSATALGAIAAIALRSISSRTQDTMLGFAAGMMLAASSFSLILPGIDAAQAMTGNQVWAACVVVAGLGLGVALMVGLERFVPHEHSQSGRKGPHT